MSVTSIDTGLVPRRSRRIGTWALQAVVAAVFFAAGGAKLAAVPFEVQAFTQIGLGQWFRIVTGVVQIVGAVALVYPRLASIGGLWLGFTMLCAVVVCLAVLHTSPVPAIRQAPTRSKVRRSWRAATAPMASVSRAVPNSEAVATSPICTGS